MKVIKVILSNDVEDQTTILCVSDDISEDQIAEYANHLLLKFMDDNIAYAEGYDPYEECFNEPYLEDWYYNSGDFHWDYVPTEQYTAALQNILIPHSALQSYIIALDSSIELP